MLRMYSSWCSLSFLDLRFGICHSFWKVFSYPYHIDIYIFCLFSLSCSGIPIALLLHLLKSSHSTSMFCSNILFSFFFLSLSFNLGRFYWLIFKPTDSFLGHVWTTDGFIKSIHFCLMFLISSISIPFLEFLSLCL